MASIQLWLKNTSAMVLDGAFHEKTYTVAGGATQVSSALTVPGLRWFNLNLVMDPFHLSSGFDISIQWLYDNNIEGQELWATVPDLAVGEAWFSDLKFIRLPAMKFLFTNQDPAQFAIFRLYFYATP